MSDLKSLIEKKFDFLRKDYGFSGPFYWNIAYEQEYTFVNGQYFLTVGFDGGFNISIGMTSILIPELSTWQVTLNNIPHKDKKLVFPFDLLSDKEVNILRSIIKPEDQLDFWVNVVENNSEIILGDWHKFSINYKVKKYLAQLFNKK